MMRNHGDWRTRLGAAMQVSQAIDSQAAALREGLVRRAGGECDRHELEQAIGALRRELEVAESLAHQWACFDEAPADTGAYPDGR